MVLLLFLLLARWAREGVMRVSTRARRSPSLALVLGRLAQWGTVLVGILFEGTVEEIQARATWIRTYDGRRIVIPNSALYTGIVTVNTAFDVRRLEYDVSAMAMTLSVPRR